MSVNPPADNPNSVANHFGLQDPRLQSVAMPLAAPSAVYASGNQSYSVADVLGGLITHLATAASNGTLPSAANLVAAVQGAMAFIAGQLGSYPDGSSAQASGTSFEIAIKNTGASTLTVVAGSGGTIVGTATVATLNVRWFQIVFTNVNKGSEAYSVYSLGASAY